MSTISPKCGTYSSIHIVAILFRSHQSISIILRNLADWTKKYIKLHQNAFVFALWALFIVKLRKSVSVLKINFLDTIACYWTRYRTLLSNVHYLLKLFLILFSVTSNNYQHFTQCIGKLKDCDAGEIRQQAALFIAMIEAICKTGQQVNSHSRKQ